MQFSDSERHRKGIGARASTPRLDDSILKNAKLNQERSLGNMNILGHQSSRTYYIPTRRRNLEFNSSIDRSNSESGPHRRTYRGIILPPGPLN